MNITTTILLTLSIVLTSATSFASEANLPKSGTIINFNAGDVACYLDIKDEQGKVHQGIMADFGICGSASFLKNQKVSFTYKKTKVPADSCQGNPECTESKKVNLIATANVN